MRNKLLLILGVFALLAASCSEPAEEGDSPTTTTEAVAGTDPTVTEPTETVPAGDGSIVSRFAGQDWYLGVVPDSAVEADSSLDPIKIGMINLEDDPFVGSFPELRFAADAAVNWINAELGGVDGRPLELIPCKTQFNPEQSRTCAQDLVREDVVALVGGIDVTSAAALTVLEENGLPLIGGIPAALEEQRSPNTFAFSGGTAGAMAAMASYAKENGATKVAIAYGEFDSFSVTAREFAGEVVKSLGLELVLVPFDLTTTDFLPTLSTIQESGADAVIVAAADTACVPVMKLFNDLEIDATLFMVGACAAEAIIDDADGNHLGVVFSGEGPADPDDIEGSMFDAASNEYNNGNAQAAGTVAFRGMMNLYALLAELGADNITSDAIIDLIRQAEDRESFWGHNYTCDGNQIPGLPSLCAPQQTLFTIASEATDITFITDWIDTVELYANAFAE